MMKIINSINKDSPQTKVYVQSGLPVGKKVLYGHKNEKITTLNREIQTVFLMTGLRWIFTSSSIIKEAARFGGNIEGMVPPMVLKRIKEKFRKQSKP